MLRSRVEIPGLPLVVCERPTWTFDVGIGEPPAGPLQHLGERQIGVEKYSLWRRVNGLRLEYSHAGTYDISADGSSIVWYAGPDSQPELMRWILLGTALALSLEAGGCLCLHGSAVAVPRSGEKRAIAFVAPKHHGKSTLAAALTLAGAELVGDDTLAVDPGPKCTIRPGVPSVRLWQDAVRQLRIDSVGATSLEGVKITVLGTGPLRAVSAALPLDAVYMLVPVLGESQDLTRTRLSRAAEAVAIAQHTKLPDSLIGLEAAGNKLRLAAWIATTVPVYALTISRDFAQLPRAVDQLLEWHGAA